MLFNIHALEWDEELLALMDIPKAMLPAVKAAAKFMVTLKIFSLPKVFR